MPYLFGWNDPFIDSLAFSVMLHMGTLVALLVYFRADWLRLVPAGLASHPRSFAARRSGPRELAWLILGSTIPAAIVGFLLNDFIETNVPLARASSRCCSSSGPRSCGSPTAGVAAAPIERLSFPAAFGIGVAQAIALFPGISRSGISISAGLFAGLDREAAARFSFLMATPIIAGAGVFEARKLVTGEAGVTSRPAPRRRRRGGVRVRACSRSRCCCGTCARNPLAVFVVYACARRRHRRVVAGRLRDDR